MYAIVEVGGKQYKIEENNFIYVNRLEGEEGSEFNLDRVLMVDNDGDITLGNPVVPGVTIKGKIMEHLKDDKVLVFKKKRRKGYKKTIGHRQSLTKLMIESISA